MAVEHPLATRNAPIDSRKDTDKNTVELLLALDAYICGAYTPERLAAVTTIATGENAAEWHAYQQRSAKLTVSQDFRDRLQHLGVSSPDPFVTRWANLTGNYLVTPEQHRKNHAVQEAKKLWSEKYQLLHYFRIDETIPDPPEQFFGGDAVKSAQRKEHDRSIRKDMHYAVYATPEYFLGIMENLRQKRNELHEEDFVTHRLTHTHEMSVDQLSALIRLVKPPAVATLQHILHSAKADRSMDEIYPWDIGYLTDAWSQKHFSSFLKPWNPVAALLHTRIPNTPNIKENMEQLVSQLGFIKSFESIHVDWESRKGKQLDRAVNVDAPFSVHVLINPTKHTSLFDYLTPFREFGHGLHFSMIDPKLPYVLRHSNSTWTEGVGEQVFATLAVEQLARTYHAPLFPAFHTINHLQTIATCLQYVEFELEYYRSDKNPVVLGNEIFTSYFPEVNGSHPFWWLQNRYIAEYPLYCINYILAAMISSQIIAYGKSHFSDILSKEFGDFLRETCYKPGRSKPWMELLKSATGEPLNPAYYIADVQQSLAQFGNK